MDFHHRRLRRRAAYAAPIKQENCFICDSYQTLYLYLFNGITDVLALLEAQNYGQAYDKLIALQQEAEERYISGE